MPRLTLIQDDFNRADNTDLGAAWDAGYTGNANLQILSNGVQSTSTTLDAVETSNVVALPNDQWGSLKIRQWGTGNQGFAVVLLRCADPPTKTCYEFMASTGTGVARTRIARWNSGTPIPLIGNATLNWNHGDVLRGEVRGNVLALYQNDALVMAVADNTLTAGRAGILMFTNPLTECVVEEFAAGAFAPDRFGLDDFPRHKHREAFLRGEL
jgi:hypothetical protein